MLIPLLSQAAEGTPISGSPFNEQKKPPWQLHLGAYRYLALFRLISPGDCHGSFNLFQCWAHLAI